MLQSSRESMPAESVDPDHKAFLDDYVGRLHRATAVDDGGGFGVLDFSFSSLDVEA